MRLTCAFALLSLFACGGHTSEQDAVGQQALRQALRLELPLAPINLVRGPSARFDGYSVGAVSYALSPDFPLSALLFEPDHPNGAGAIVAHGHYGRGKNSEEAAEIAHGLAASGLITLVVDTPGVEEGDRPARQIHGAEGAQNRDLLLARGSSAMALQVAGLRRGVDLLAELGATRVVATGASGGAVQALYLMIADDRVLGAALASPPDIPRASLDDGCTCDWVPGWQTERLLSLVDRPTLWMSDQVRSRPAGLGPLADFEVLEGPHSYTPQMQTEALRWFGALLGLPMAEARPGLAVELHMPTLSGSIRDLPLPTSINPHPP